MFYGETIQETRQVFFSSWEKYQQKKPLSPLEQQVVQVILEHPEYHKILENPMQLQQTYISEQEEPNPFMHMGLHLALREQVMTDRPRGIHDIYKKLIIKYLNPLIVEHLMMELLTDCLWQAYKNNRPPDEVLYLSKLNEL